MQDSEPVPGPSQPPAGLGPINQEPTCTNHRRPARLREYASGTVRRFLNPHDLSVDVLKRLLQRVLNLHHGTDDHDFVLFEGFEIRQEPELLELREIYFHDTWQTYWLISCEYGNIDVSSFHFDDNLPIGDLRAYAFCRNDYTRRHILHIPGDCILPGH